MSNPLARAEARQAAEKWFAENRHAGFDMCTDDEIATVEIPNLAAIIAESYADLVRQTDEIALELSQTIIAKDELFNEALRMRNALEILSLNLTYRPLLKQIAEAAINSATPKQGEGK